MLLAPPSLRGFIFNDPLSDSFDDLCTGRPAGVFSVFGFQFLRESQVANRIGQAAAPSAPSSFRDSLLGTMIQKVPACSHWPLAGSKFSALFSLW